MKRIVITGLGAVTPLGLSVAESWERAQRGESGIVSHPIRDFLSCKIAGIPQNFDYSMAMTSKDARRIDVFMRYGIVAGEQAIADAGLGDVDPSEVGVLVGSGMGGSNMVIQSALDAEAAKSERALSPFAIAGSIINMISGHLSIRHGFTGPNLAVSTACATSTHAIALAARLIACGDAKVMIAGGAEASTNTLGLGAFGIARTLSLRNDEPTKASRPWDKDRDGFVMAEGAGVLVLEEYEHAKARGAKIYAELRSSAMNGDAYHITSPREDGSGAADCMRKALKLADLSPNDIGYINAHGTSTLAGDVAETAAIKSVFGSHPPPVSSTKSMTGHLLGAAGSVEALFAILALRDQILPPTINLDNPGEGCDIDYVPHKARKASFKTAISNSFGFGGTNGVLVFSSL